MELTVGFALCGSFCTLEKAVTVLERVAGQHRVIPILSRQMAGTDTRFGRAGDWRKRIEAACGRTALTAVEEAEPIGPKHLLDVLVICPCTGNTLGKLACGITDGPVTMAAKAHLRNGRPLVLAIATNDGLGAAAANIGRLMNRKNIYFVPFRQDDCRNKPTSLIAEFDLVEPTLEAALCQHQLQPLLLESR